MGKTEGMFSVFLSIFLCKRHSTLGQKSSNMIFKSNSNQGDNRVDVKQANFLLVNIKLTVFFLFLPLVSNFLYDIESSFRRYILKRQLLQLLGKIIMKYKVQVHESISCQ